MIEWILFNVPGGRMLRNLVWRPFHNYWSRWLKSSRKSLPEIHDNLFPHMKDYDKARSSLWLPFVMESMEPQIKTDAVNTDHLGFRYSVDHNGSIQSVGTTNIPSSEVSLLVGGSTVFGVGATSDSRTITSQLAVIRREPWYNLGMRGYVLSQNLHQFTVFRRQIGSVRRIVLLAGWNELVFFLRSPLFVRYFGGFHGLIRYFTQMNRAKVDFTRNDLRFPKEWASIIHFSTDKQEARPLFSEHIANVLDNWKFVAEGLDARLIFALQPISFCSPHVLTKIERAVIDSEDRSPEGVAEQFEQWGNSLFENECRKLNIDFYDFNKSYGADLDESLFLDAVHLTNRGNETLAMTLNNIISKQEVAYRTSLL